MTPPTPPSSRCKICGKETEQPFHTCLKPSSTPETDKASDVDNIIPGKGSWVFIDFARNLERGRDEARQESKRAWGLNTSLNVQIAMLIGNRDALINERDSLQSQLSQAKEILGYDDGDLLDNVTRFKKYAESEINTLRANNEEAIREHERMTEQLSTLRKDKERLDWLESHNDNVCFSYSIGNLDTYEEVTREAFDKMRTVIDVAIKGTK